MKRVVSIDVFRGLTMFLMIWVNDFWTLQGIPKWLKHAASGEDYLGFSDLIFPWFLFVVGMSIPFAFENRVSRGEAPFTTWKHILIRSIALLVMGLFHMNMEMYNHDISLLSKPIYVIICTAAFFMIWNVVPKAEPDKRVTFKALPILGVLILAAMFLIYKGKGYDGAEIGFSTHWWGILGLIGWVYLIAATVYLVFRKSMAAAIIAFCACLALNIISSSGIPYNIFAWQSGNWIPGSGGLQALAFGGIITSLLLIQYRKGDNTRTLYGVLLFLGAASLAVGLLLRNQFIISKISGTPTWILVSLSSSLFLFVLLHWIADVKGKINWYSPIKTAGTATLTCYLIPYFYYSFRTILGIELPAVFTTGLIGLVKSLVYSFIIIGLSWSLTRIKVQLKI
jgi:hypothetical protein